MSKEWRVRSAFMLAALGCAGDDVRVVGGGGQGGPAPGDDPGEMPGAGAPSTPDVGSPAAVGGSTGSGASEAPLIPRRDGEAPAPDAPAHADVTPLDAASWVFDDAALRTYELTLPADAWEALQANARAEEYVPADLVVDGERLPDVGLRFKGGYGTLYSCLDEAGIQFCSKLSMKIKFDEYVSDQRLRGLKRLNFHSMRNDPSLMHDRLGYRMFREMGLAAPRATHARLVVNGEYRGVFSLVEEVDGRFTESRFSAGDGNLYKECWPESEDVAALDECLETNEERADHSGMLAFEAALRDAAPDELAAAVARHTDVEQMLTYLAVDHTINNWDGVTGFYCSVEGCDSFNFYWYQQEGQARFTLVPWDLDQTFALSTQFDAFPGPLDIPEDCSVRYPIAPGLSGQAPACDPVFQGLARGDRAAYVAALASLVDGPLDLERANAWLDAWQAQIEPAVAEDSFGPSRDAFVAAVAGLREDLRVLRLRAIAERDGAAVEPFRLAPGEVEGFESASPLAVGLGITRSSTSTSNVAVTLADDGALGGARDLLLRVELRDGSSPWGQWAQVRFPLTAPVELDSGSRLRLRVRSDGPRVLRIGIDSSAYTNRGASGELGWSVNLDGTAQTLELELGSAQFPAWGRDVSDPSDSILASTTGLLLEPAAEGRNGDGWLGAGVVDIGELRVDDIELVP